MEQILFLDLLEANSIILLNGQTSNTVHQSPKLYTSENKTARCLCYPAFLFFSFCFLDPTFCNVIKLFINGITTTIIQHVYPNSELSLFPSSCSFAALEVQVKSSFRNFRQFLSQILPSYQGKITNLCKLPNFSLLNQGIFK